MPSRDTEDSIDSEAPDASDVDDSDSVELVDCPECGRSIYEDAERCPYCGEWVTHAGSRRVWVVVAILLVLAATVVRYLW